ncbi:hypothetical protein ABMA75_02415 [Halobacteriovorax sp. ZH4_bin.1]|uniref:COG1470 family protein n=1 Tax=unclassified Halobacteriovorax TaxID=2639665 RepID=UPI00371D1AA0
MKKIRIGLSLFAFFINLLVFGNDLDISMLPDKSVQPGEVAIQVLPIKSPTNTTYKISIESNQQWRAEGPEFVELIAGDLTYLTFYTYTPSFVDAGTIHELKIIFTNIETQEKIENSISFVVAKKRDLDFFDADQNIETNKKNHTLNLKVKNTGNASEVYNFSIRNLTPEVSVSVNSSPITIAANEVKLLPVRVNFKNSTSTYAAFEVNAKVGGITKFQKKFQVKFVSSANNQDRQGNYLDTTLTITNDYMSVEGRDSNLSSVVLNSNGALSDYVSLSSYVQANMVNGQAQDARGTFHFDGDSWRFSAGNNVDLDVDANVGNEARDGVAYTRDILPNLKVGTLVGVDENDEFNTAAMVQYDPRPGQRTFVVINQNSDSGETSGSIGYRGNFNPNDKLSFAPSLTISDDPQRGVIQDYRTAVRYMVRKNLPIAISSGYRKDRFQEVIYNNASLSYDFDGVLIELSRNDELARDTFATNEQDRQHRSSNQVRVSFPMGGGLSASVNYQDHTSSSVKEQRKFITFAYQNKQLYAAMRAGVASKNYTDGNIQDYTNEPFVSVDLSYKAPKFTIRSHVEYESYGDDSYRTRTNIGIDYNIDNNHFNGSAYVRVGHDEGQRRDYVTQTQTDLDYIEAGIRTGTDSNYSFEIYTRAEDNHQYDDIDYQVGIRFQYRFGAKTPRKVEDAFGGKRTGSIAGRICIDRNLNGTCEDFEKGVEGLSIYSVTGSATTDKDGKYLINELKPDIDHISLIERQVTAKSLESSEYYKGTKVLKNQTVYVDFALKEISTINTFSYNDINKNGRYDKDFDTLIGDITYQLIDENNEIIPISGKSLNTINYSRLRNGQYKLSATANSPIYKDVQKEVILDLPRDNMQTVTFGFELIDVDTLPIQDLIITEFDNSIISAPKFSALLTLDSAETEYNILSNISVKLDGYQVDIETEEVYSGLWDINLDLKNLISLISQKNEITIDIELENENGKKLQIKRVRNLFYNN